MYFPNKKDAEIRPLHFCNEKIIKTRLSNQIGFDLDFDIIAAWDNLGGDG